MSRIKILLHDYTLKPEKLNNIYYINELVHILTPDLLELQISIATTANTEMTITPEGATNFNGSVSLRLEGTFSSEASRGPYEAVISGVNLYRGLNFSCGVYGKDINDWGLGVHGHADGHHGYGIYGEAVGIYGSGVFGYASGSSGEGVYGKSSGSTGVGVYGMASYTGNVTNFGGYFIAQGLQGRGIYAEASRTSEDAKNYGGYFIARGGKDGTAAVYGNAANNGEDVTNYGGIFYAWGGTGTGVYGYGKQRDFYAGGPGANYLPFTGAHEVKFGEDIPKETVSGLIVSVTGATKARREKNGNISLSSTLPTVTLSTTARDKTVFGVLVSQSPLPEGHWYPSEAGERFGVVNALGEGRVWVTDINGQIQAGDYITTSSIPGYGQMQDDDLLHSYTLGKVIETIDWEQVTDTVQHGGKAYKCYLLAVVYTSG